jgi:dipeptidyl-peptidase 4
MKKIIASVALILCFTGVFCQVSGKNITLEDIWAKFRFYPRTVSGVNSMNDGIHFTSLSSDAEGNVYILKYEYKTGKLVDTLVKNIDLVMPGDEGGISIQSYSLSEAEDKYLIATETEAIYRHSTQSHFYIWDIKEKKLLRLSEDEKQQLAKFSPDGSKVAFVRSNNLYVKDLINNREVAVTTDGKLNEIINGAPDWVYEEEFSFSRAFAWSYDSKYLAYYRFDERRVPFFNLTFYGNELYPDETQYKYPKAGETNSTVDIYIYELATGKNVRTEINSEQDQYIARINWSRIPGKLSIQRLNRHQNRLDLLLADATTGKTTILFTETTDKYFEKYTDTEHGAMDAIYFLNDGKQFLWTSEEGGYNHIYLYNMDGKLVRQITKGNWEVTKVYGVDETNKIIYFESHEVSPMEVHIYSIKMDGSGKKKLTTEKGVNSADFSQGFRYFINFNSSTSKPADVTLHDASGKLIRVLENNRQVKEVINEYNLGSFEFIKVPTENNIMLNGYMIKPPGFSASNKYPVLMFCYGGPGKQTVVNEYNPFDYFWFQMLAQQGYIVVSVDNRGTPGRGADFKKANYLQLGKLETIDQTNTAKHLASLPYVDSDRIGIFGWSYGGYLVALCLTKAADVFKMGIAVAPVTNWRFYDTIYTERFLRTPQENPEGYDDNSPINFVDQLQGKLLLVHGMADDNVHLQNSVLFTQQLIRKNKQFEMLYYPDRNHGIYGAGARLHLYTKMTDFIKANL